MADLRPKAPNKHAKKEIKKKIYSNFKQVHKLQVLQINV